MVAELMMVAAFTMAGDDVFGGCVHDGGWRGLLAAFITAVSCVMMVG